MELDGILKIQTKLNNITDRNKLNEEQTKTSLIMPLFMQLGYDVFNIDEFVPEYTADFGTKQGEKVDYAICINGQPLILIEAKKLGMSLGKDQVSQLFRYYSSTDAKIAILTNGDDYWFFTDSIKANTMDMEPYLKLKLSTADEPELAKFTDYKRDKIEDYDISSGVQLQKYQSTVRDFIEKLYNDNLDASFIEYLQSLSGVYGIEKSDMQNTFNKIFIERMYINRNNIAKNKNDTIDIGADINKLENVEIGKEHIFTNVDWTFHKPKYIVLCDKKYMVKSFKQMEIVVVQEICNSDSSMERRLLEAHIREIALEFGSNFDGGVAPIENTSLKLLTWLSASEIKKVIKKVLDVANISYDNLKICFER